MESSSAAVQPDLADGPYPKPAPEALKAAVRAIMQPQGRLYAQIPHPDFADWPSSNPLEERRRIIGPALEYPGGTVLDIGCYLAAVAHWLEELGYRVTAIERDPDYAFVARQIRELCGKKFEFIEGSFYDLPTKHYDIVLALNIFHHSLKRKDRFEQLEVFLRHLDCNMMIYESHRTGEAQMAKAYRNMAGEEMTAFIGSCTKLTHVETIGDVRGRKYFKLKKE